MSDPFDVVRQFEAELCAYTGARYAVAVTSCTAAILLACAWFQRTGLVNTPNGFVYVPNLTYVGVPQSVMHAGYEPRFYDLDWQGEYQLDPLPVFDAARRFTSEMYDGGLQCVSFHHSKILGLAAHGGAILHDSPDADAWLRKARFDGRTEGVAPKDDTFTWPAWHVYMTPATAAEGLMRLSVLPRHNDDLPRSDYADLSKAPIFQ